MNRTSLRVLSEKRVGVKYDPAALFEASPMVGVRRNHGGHGPYFHAVVDRQNPGLDQLTCPGPENAGPDDAATLIGQRNDASFGPAFGPCPVIIGQISLNPPGGDALLFGLTLGQADMRQLRVGVGDPWNSAIIDPGGQAEQRVADDNPGMIPRNMGKLLPSCGITDGKNTAIAAPQTAIRGDPAPASLNPCRFEVELVQIGFAANSDQQMAALNRAAPFDLNLDRTIGPRHRGDTSALNQGDAIGLEPVTQ